MEDHGPSSDRSIRLSMQVVVPSLYGMNPDYKVLSHVINNTKASPALTGKVNLELLKESHCLQLHDQYLYN